MNRRTCEFCAHAAMFPKPEPVQREPVQISAFFGLIRRTMYPSPWLTSSYLLWKQRHENRRLCQRYPESVDKPKDGTCAEYIVGPQRAQAAPTDIERWREAKSDEWTARGDPDEAFAYLSGARDDEFDPEGVE